MPLRPRRASGDDAGKLMPQGRTGLVWHELFMWHDTGHAAQWVAPGLTVEPAEHVESPAAKRRIRNLLEVSGRRS